jgi:small subunit ribosomal protein S9
MSDDLTPADEPTPDPELNEEPAAEQPAERDSASAADTPVQAAPAAAGPDEDAPGIPAGTMPAATAPEPAGSEPEPAAAESTPVDGSDTATAEPQVTAAGQDDTVEAEVEYIEEDDEGPRVKPAIPGMDLTPDLSSEGDQFLDAETRAAAEAEAEEAALRAAADSEDQVNSQPIADAAINLAADARYTATGKRKTAVARVIVRPGTGEYLINGKSLNDFFPRDTLQRVIRQPLETVGYDNRMDVIARLHGGGVAAQAGALRHGISRALLEADPNLRGELKRRGFLTRDPRVKERKKAGLKKARKRPQFSKR